MDDVGGGAPRAERRRRPDLSGHVRSIAPLAAVWAVGLVVVGMIVGQDVPSREFFLDPSMSARVTWYTGTVSHFGVLGWATAAISACWGSYVASLGGRTGARDFLRAGAVVSTLVLFDDLFLLHSAVLPIYFGLPKQVGIVLVMGSAMMWIGQYRSELRRTGYSVLIAAGAMLCVSILIDQIPLGLQEHHSLIAEDTAKFLGIEAWALYFVLTAGQITRSVIADREAAASSVARAQLLEELGGPGRAGRD